MSEHEGVAVGSVGDVQESANVGIGGVVDEFAYGGCGQEMILIARREHELFGKPEGFDELQDISDARYLLRAPDQQPGLPRSFLKKIA